MMTLFNNLFNKMQDVLEMSFKADFIAPLLLRLYLVPVFYVAGMNKASDFEGTVKWFGEEWGLGLPYPMLMAILATAAELGGAVLLLFGFATRWISIPLMITMLVAMFAVHWKNGWLAIAGGDWPFATDRTEGALERLEVAKGILREHGNLGYLIENGRFVILNNGIEFAATYFIMLLALFFIGGGRWVSADYWIARQFRNGMPKAPKAPKAPAMPPRPATPPPPPSPSPSSFPGSSPSGGPDDRGPGY